MCLEGREFKAKVRETNGFSELIELYRAPRSDDRRYSGTRMCFDKAYSLISSLSQAIELWNTTGGTSIPSRDKLLLEKVVELAKTRQDLDRVYYVLAISEQEIRYRRFIRKIFDKADKLRYPKI